MPGKPTENAYVESFHGRLRDECLNARWFPTLHDVRGTLAIPSTATVRNSSVVNGLIAVSTKHMRGDLLFFVPR
jgi:transposase InsO family protein